MMRVFCVSLLGGIQVQNNFKTNERIARIVDVTTMLVLECHSWGEIKSEDNRKGLRGENAV